jgi:hypothetical protein
MKFIITIKPAIPVKLRRSIEDLIEKAGYNVHGSGACCDLAECDISFSDKDVDET